MFLMLFPASQLCVIDLFPKKIANFRMAINMMSGNLTQQVRAFTQVGAAAVNGDFSRLVTVEASGEMDSLKTQINQMVCNLRESTQLGTGTREQV